MLYQNSVKVKVHENKNAPHLLQSLFQPTETLVVKPPSSAQPSLQNCAAHSESTPLNLGR